MKRFLAIALVAAFVMGLATTASATEFKAKGELHFSAQWSDNADFVDSASEASGDTSEDDFTMQQRTRLYLDAIASEALMATFGFEIDNTWGENGAGANRGDVSADAVQVEVKRAVMAWTVPSTALNITMGIQGLALPAAIGNNPIFNDDVASITASYKFNDMVSATAFWARLNDSNNLSSGLEEANDAEDEFDAWGLILPVALDGVSFTPYYMGAQVGTNSANINAINFGGAGLGTDPVEAWWLGTTLNVSAFDPILFMADFMMGSVSVDNVEASEASGWRMDAALAYKMDMMTPMLVFNYGSGDDDDATDGSEMMPALNTSTNWGVTNMGTAGGGSGTANNIDGILGGASGAAGGTANPGTTGTGVMAVGLVLDQITFVENLSNTIRVVYYRGTTDEDYANAAAFTEDDDAWEINLDTSYQIMDNLSTLIEFGWVTVDADENVATRGGVDPLPDDAMKLSIYLDYTF